ncbi:hypothetical protein HPB52_015522 [Rhipicephalus sanguineus]|uniref:Uncharacterized protein n=1 Tax=Rhipicephalus sanguineus TaxID=34632 RepID=A0A9D4T3W9_RHISA|nr:hypothetical protein HPB52_015522 [Rhipicephalus sanguineus]
MIGRSLPAVITDYPVAVALPPHHRSADVYLSLALAQERSRLTIAYRQQGLPVRPANDRLVPTPPNLRALHSLLEFVEATGITAYR